jgi:hypothetical protein
VGTLREVRLVASRGNRVQTNAEGTGFRAVRRGPVCGCETFGISEFRILGLGITICGKLEVEDWKWNG